MNTLSMSILKWASAGAVVLGSAIGSARADVVFIQSNTQNETYRYDVNPAGAPVLLSTITHASFQRPYGLSMRPGGDLLVISRGPCTDCVGGGVTPIAALCGVTGPAGTPFTSGFRTPHDGAVRGDELIIIDSYNAKLRRLGFGPSGEVVDHGAMGVTFGQTGRGLTMWPGGDQMLVSLCCDQNAVRRFSFDSSGGLAETGTITGNGLSNPHGLVVGPGNELFVANISGNSVSRFLLTDTGATPNGVITGNGLNGPTGVAFSPWGELLVTNSGEGSVRRFTFGPGGAAVANGGFAIPSPGDDLLFVTGAPAIARGPRPAFSCPGGSVTLEVITVGANAGAPVSVQWRKDGADIAGATGLTYTIAALTPERAGVYDCRVSNSCGGGGVLTSAGAAVSICNADLNCDGVVDFGDYLQFLNFYDAQDPAVDFNQDGLVDFGDYLEFLNLYDAGC